MKTSLESDLSLKEGIAMLVILVVVIVALVQLKMFRLDDGGNTATRGLISQDTINLEEYKLVGESKFRWSCWSGGYLYTRSAINETTFVCGKRP